MGLSAHKACVFQEAHLTSPLYGILAAALEWVVLGGLGLMGMGLVMGLLEIFLLLQVVLACVLLLSGW